MKTLMNNIWRIADRYRSFVIVDDMVPAIVRMIFTKYAIDNYLFADTKEEMTYYANAQKALLSGDAHNLVNELTPIYNMIDTKLGTSGLLADIPHLMSNDFFGEYNKKKTYSVEHSAREFMSMMADFDCSKENNQGLFEELIAFIYESMERIGKRKAGDITSRSISLLASKVLEVNEDDVYKDFVCGYGLSTFEIIKKDVKKAYLSDIDAENVKIAAMLSIIENHIYNKTTFDVSDAFYDNSGKELADKIFVDIPFNSKADRNEHGISDGNILLIRRVLDNLKQDGKAIVTCPSNLLFRESKETIDFRKELVNCNRLEAVITLPPVMYGTSINVNLLVFSKNNNESVLFIDAKDNKVIQFSNNAKSIKTELTDDGINRLVRILNKKETITGVAKVITNNEVVKKGTLVPAAYIESVKKEAQISYSELNDRLNNLYKKLNNIV